MGAPWFYNAVQSALFEKVEQLYLHEQFKPGRIAKLLKDEVGVYNCLRVIRARDEYMAYLQSRLLRILGVTTEEQAKIVHKDSKMISRWIRDLDERRDHRIITRIRHLRLKKGVSIEKIAATIPYGIKVIRDRVADIDASIRRINRCRVRQLYSRQTPIKEIQSKLKLPLREILLWLTDLMPLTEQESYKQDPNVTPESLVQANPDIEISELRLCFPQISEREINDRIYSYRRESNEHSYRIPKHNDIFYSVRGLTKLGGYSREQVIRIVSRKNVRYVLARYRKQRLLRYYSLRDLEAKYPPFTRQMKLTKVREQNISSYVVQIPDDLNQGYWVTALTMIVFRRMNYRWPTIQELHTILYTNYRYSEKTIRHGRAEALKAGYFLEKNGHFFATTKFPRTLICHPAEPIPGTNFQAAAYHDFVESPTRIVIVKKSGSAHIKSGPQQKAPPEKSDFNKRWDELHRKV